MFLFHFQTKDTDTYAYAVVDLGGALGAEVPPQILNYHY